MGGDHDAFQAFWEAGGPWPPLALSVIVGIVTLTIGLMLVYHGTSMSSSPLILCSVTGLLIGLALTVVLPQALERLMTVMPSERIFIIFILAPLAMFIWEHVILDHQHIHPLADGSTAGCGDVGCDDGCGPLPEEAPDTSAPGGGWAFKPKKAKPGEKTSLLGKGKKGTVMPSGMPGGGEAGAPAAAEGGTPSRWIPKMLQPGCQPIWLIWLFEKWALLMRLGAWLIHSFFDGIILGSSDPRPSVMLPLTFAILVCAVQDVAGMYIYFSTRKVDRTFLVCGIIGFAFCFPAGAGVSVAAFWGQRQSEWVDLLRVALAGLFVYMALFEMAPPHAHGRWMNLKYALAFSFGLGSAYLADAFEEAMHPHRQQQQGQQAVPRSINAYNTQYNTQPHYNAYDRPADRFAWLLRLISY
jgi:zinc transporter ZupT